MLQKCCFVMVTVAVLLMAVPVARAGQKGGSETTVTMKNLTFQQANVTVKVGDKVTWSNADDRDHTVAGDGFKSGNIKPGGTYSYTFTKAGTYRYGCSYHPRMRGTITVTE